MRSADRWPAAALAALPVAAAPITETFDFAATGYGSDAPFPTVSGSATVTFDPAVDQTLTPLPSFTSNLPASYGPFSFVYFALERQLQVGDACTDFGCSAGSGSNEAYLAFQLNPGGYRSVVGRSCRMGPAASSVSSSRHP